MSGVLVFGEITAGKLSTISLEVASAGAQIAEALGEPLFGAVFRGQLDSLAQEFKCDFDTLYLIDGEADRRYTAVCSIEAAQTAIKACSPSVVLFAQTIETREWVPRLAARLNTGLVTDCIGLSMDRGALLVTKPVYGGSVLGEFSIRKKPSMATIRSGIFEARLGALAANVQRLKMPDLRSTGPELLDEVHAESSSGLRLKDAKIVVAGGRGIGGADNWHIIEKMAGVLGAAVGCSRPVADSGWVQSSHQVGLSGAAVKPELYIAVGISGAVQHLAGISNSSVVVAVNVDSNAEIFTRANFGVVGDYKEVLPGFIERVTQLRS